MCLLGRARLNPVTRQMLLGDHMVWYTERLPWACKRSIWGDAWSILCMMMMMMMMMMMKTALTQDAKLGYSWSSLTDNLFIWYATNQQNIILIYESIKKTQKTYTTGIAPTFSPALSTGPQLCKSAANGEFHQQHTSVDFVRIQRKKGAYGHKQAAFGKHLWNKRSSLISKWTIAERYILVNT